MARMSRLVKVFNVQCVMCSRVAGQLLNGTFIQRLSTRPPVAGNGRSRCGECGGNLYLEPDDAITPYMMEQMLQERAASAARQSAPAPQAPTPIQRKLPRAA